MDANYSLIVPTSETNDVFERRGRLILSGFPNVAIPSPRFSFGCAIVDSSGRDILPTYVGTVLQNTIVFIYLDKFPPKKTDEALCSAGKLISNGGESRSSTRRCL
jgi:hypothetical protein